MKFYKEKKEKEEKLQCGNFCSQSCCYSSDELPPCLPRPTKDKETPLYTEMFNSRRRVYDTFMSTAEKMGERGCSIMKNPENHSRFWQEFAKEWDRLNPDPPIKRDEFIRQLHDRITALEAVIAEKGGAQ